jgi:hypothetical protein
MKAGSPGMESPTPDAYDVIAFRDRGSTYLRASAPPGR